MERKNISIKTYKREPQIWFGTEADSFSYDFVWHLPMQMYGAFGEDLYGNQGVLQVFGYTGYQRDNVAGTYYAQAREYQAEVGRFAGQDLIAGFMDMPLSMNRYSYGMIMKYDKMVAITQAESQRKMNIAKNTISDMLKNMERITVAELVKRTGLSRGFFYKNELIRREMDDAIHRQEAIFKNRHPVAMDRKLENSVIELKIELLKAKAENEKLAEQNQELKRKNELLQQELEKLNKRVSRKEISVLKKL